MMPLQREVGYDSNSFLILSYAWQLLFIIRIIYMDLYKVLDMNKNEIVNVLLENGFEEHKYKSVVSDEYKTEYVPKWKNVEIYINNIISIRITDNDGVIRLFNDELLFLGNYQNYWGGWFKNKIGIDSKIIDNISIYGIV